MFRTPCGPIFTEVGSHLYRFAFLAAQELLLTARGWRNAIDQDGPGQLDLGRAVIELEAAVERMEIALLPPVVDGQFIDPRDVPLEPPDSPQLDRLRSAQRVNIAAKLAEARGATVSAFGFPGQSAHEVVLVVGAATLRCLSGLAQVKRVKNERGVADLLRADSPLRTEIRGLGTIPAEQASFLETECLREAEAAWQMAKTGEPHGPVLGGFALSPAKPGAGEAEPDKKATKQDEQPARYLFSWREILGCLNLANDEETRGRVSRLNQEHDGPIIVTGKGGQPKVEKSKLIEWWNRLEILWRDQANQQVGNKMSGEAQYDYGATGTVAPEVSGGVKKRRRDRKP